MSEPAASAAKTTLTLSSAQLRYLEGADYLELPLRAALEGAERLEVRHSTWIVLDAAVAERLEESLMLRLCHAGFGVDYRPTEEGDLIEGILIEAFPLT